jgi:hypothetical protein
LDIERLPTLLPRNILAGYFLMMSGLGWGAGMTWMNIVTMEWINVDEDEEVMTRWRGI